MSQHRLQNDTIQSPLLIIRFVLFSLLVYLNLLILIFASWHIHATATSNMSVPWEMVFLISNSCTLFFFVALGLAELVTPRAKSAQVKFECGWSAALSILQIGATISLTVNGPVIMCQSTSTWSVCASSSLLLPTTWSSSLILLSYFVGLFATAMAHVRTHPAVWTSTLYTMSWFRHHSAQSVNDKLGWDSSPSDETSPSDLYKHDNKGPWNRSFKLEDLESGSKPKHQNQKGDAEHAPWAQSLNIRRGVDNPFTTRDDMPSARSSPTSGNTSLPPLPIKVYTKGSRPGETTGSRYVEQFRESQTISRPESPSQFGLHFTSRVDPFPRRVDDHDLPIPLPRLSEWIRADAIRGINVHTVPYSP